MVTHATDRDLSVEEGIVIGAPGVFYPATTEEPNYTEERYAAFMRLILDDVTRSGWVIERRERYYPGPPNTAGGVGHVVEIITPVLSVAGPTVMSILFWLYPDEGKLLGSRIKAGLSARQFYKSWRRSCDQVGIEPEPLDFPSFLQPNIEGLCLLDAISGRSDSEQDFRIVSVVSSADDYASAAHPSGPETYETSIASNEVTYKYLVNGRGRGVKEVRGRRYEPPQPIEVDLLGLERR
jgi:hypothetical protein